MKETKSLEELTRRENTGNTKVCLDTSIKDFVEIIRKDKNMVGGKYLTNGLQLCLIQIEKYVDTIGDLKKLAENVDGFSRLKFGIIYNNERKLPSTALRAFGKKKLEYLNEILSQYKIEQIPWVTKKYVPGERQEEWWRKVKI